MYKQLDFVRNPPQKRRGMTEDHQREHQEEAPKRKRLDQKSSTGGKEIPRLRKKEEHKDI